MSSHINRMYHFQRASLYATSGKSSCNVTDPHSPPDCFDSQIQWVAREVSARQDFVVSWLRQGQLERFETIAVPAKN